MDQLFSGSGPASLKTAIEAIRGPGGALATAGGDSLQVQRTQANRLYEHAGAQYIGGELIVRVIGPGG
ncbi:hypothetical protein [Frankia sp. AgW1.1]|nr:hypothetical protein [Frankia sp. AgW1.1]MBL7492519.1 hypothetical protein [Frankia sp. AgW1.1]